MHRVAEQNRVVHFRRNVGSSASNERLYVPAECIHGLDSALCDQCTPKAMAPSVPAARTTPTRTRTVRQRVAPRRAPLLSEKATVVDHGAKRIFHVTHLRNVPGILDAGCIRSDALGAEPVVDLSSVDNRQNRREAEVTPGVSVAGFVPFFLAPLADVWAGVLSRVADERLAAGARVLPASEFVMFVSTVKHAGMGAVLADGDAAGELTRFTPLTGDILRVPSLDEERELTAELLVPGSFALEAVTLVGVANDKARSQVRNVLRGSAFSPKIAVYPPWFQPVERD